MYGIPDTNVADAEDGVSATTSRHFGQAQCLLVDYFMVYIHEAITVCGADVGAKACADSHHPQAQ